MRMDFHAIEEGVEGTLRLMKHLEMIDAAPIPREQNKLVWNSSWIRARTAGIFHPHIKAGEFINKNQLVGSITDPFGEFKEEIKAQISGYVVGLNNNPVVNAGRCVDACRYG